MFLGMLWLAISPAAALELYQTNFEARYTKRGRSDSKEIAQKKVILARAIDVAKCNVCHVGKDKKKRNGYGKELAKLLIEVDDVENAKEVIKAIEEVGKVKSDPRDKKSPTFGDLMGQGKLPAQMPRKKTRRRVSFDRHKPPKPAVSVARLTRSLFAIGTNGSPLRLSHYIADYVDNETDNQLRHVGYSTLLREA